MLPDVDTTREYWVPTPEEAAELATINPRAAQDARRIELFIAWRQAQLLENSRRKALNEVTKARIDVEVKDFKERKDTIMKIMGGVLEDMTASRERIEKYVRELAEGANPAIMAITLDRARV